MHMLHGSHQKHATHHVNEMLAQLRVQNTLLLPPIHNGPTKRIVDSFQLSTDQKAELAFEVDSKKVDFMRSIRIDAVKSVCTECLEYNYCRS